MKNSLTMHADRAAYLSGLLMLLSFAALVAFLASDAPRIMQAGTANQQSLTGDLITFFQALSVLLMIPIAFALPVFARTRAASLSRAAMIIGILGMGVLVAFSLLVVVRVMSEPQAGVPISFAYGAIGVWLIGANYSARGGELSTRLAWLGVVIGAALVLWTIMYWVSGAAYVESPAVLQSNVLFLIGTAALGLSSYILYPMWAFWLGRVLANATAHELRQATV